VNAILQVDELHSIRQFDDFAWDAEGVRNSVVNGGFTTQTGPDGGQYTGISMLPVPQWPERIAELLGRAIIPRISCFRLNLAGEFPHSWVHSDAICAKYASVLYLNTSDQCKGGTAFWRHKTTAMTSLPDRQWLLDTGLDPDSFYRQMEKDWKNIELWEQEEVVSMKWNRFITYPTCLFHSRFPFEGFGAGPRDGRLIWICFYDLAEEVAS
jgi:Family of unknown function (DUF6445)